MTYTEKELDQFLHGISLSLLSKKSAQHWRYDEETAKEIEWLEALERKVRADKADRKTEPTISKMEQVDKDINVRSKDEPTTQTKTQKSNLSFEKADEPQTEDFKACIEGLTLLWIYNYVTDDEFHRIDARLKCKDEPQTDCAWK